MRNAFIASIIFHVLLLLAFSLNLSFSSKSIHSPNTMIFDYVRIDEKTAAPKLSPVEKKKEEKKTEKKEEIKKKEDLPPPQKTESVMDQNEPTPEEEKKKDTTQPEDKKPDPKKESDQIPLKNKKQPPKQEKKKAVEKQKNKKITPPNKNKQKKKKNANTKAQVNLKKDKSNAKKQKEDPKKSAKALNDLLLDADNDSSDDENSARTDHVADVFTASRIDAIKSTIKKCWIIPPGLAKEMIVDLKMQLTEDGTVVKAEVSNQSRVNSDPDFRLAAEAARRAVLDPECNPLPMPKEHYKDWKNLELEFDPKDMF